jgi:predicted porin
VTLTSFAAWRARTHLIRQPADAVHFHLDHPTNATMKTYPLLVSLLACCTAATAQSSVTVSGRIDLAMRRVDNGVASRTLLQRDGSTSNRLVFSGREDLGGGLAAGFVLDAALRPDTGTAASTFWDRRSTVSLYGKFGEVRLGRDGALQNSGPGDFDALNGKGVGNVMNLATPFNFSFTNTFSRINNAISYVTPNTLGGFYGQLQWSPSEGGVGNRSTTIGLGYLKGPLEARFTHGRNATNQVATVNALTGASVAPANATTAPTGTGYWTYTNAGASYDFRAIKVMGSVTEFRSAQALSGAGRRKEIMINVGGMVPVGQAGSVNFAYTRADRSGLGSDEQDADQLAVQYMYRLSKRTSLYASLAYLRQDALATVANSRYNIDGTDVLGRSGKGMDLGIQHRF